MKIDDFAKIAKIGFPASETDHAKMYEYLRSIGVDPENIYQELEMSARFVNTHRDTSHTNTMIFLHSHDYFELLYLHSGAGVEYLVGSDRYRLQKGDIILVPPGISHRPILPETLQEPYVRDVLWISREFMDNFFRTFPDKELERYDLAGPIRTAGTRWEFLGELFQNGVREEAEKRSGWETAVLGNTLLIFANLKRAMLERSAGTMQAEKPELLDRIAAYIETNYAQHITIDDLARQFYVSNSTISHLFKQKMGVSLYRYITQRRLIAAKTLIGRGEPLESVSRRVGFVDYSTFYRAFRQEYGISPRQFGRL